VPAGRRFYSSLRCGVTAVNCVAIMKFNEKSIVVLNNP
jgi:hypothetical protein